jgi:hypothetical protein
MTVCIDNVVMSQTVAFASYQFMVIKTTQMLQLICLSLSGVFCLIFVRKIGVGAELIQPRSMFHENEFPCGCQNWYFIMVVRRRNSCETHESPLSCRVDV